MGFRLVIITLVAAVALASSPVVLVSEDSHTPLFTTADLLQYVAGQSTLRLIELNSTLGLDFAELKAVLKQANLAKEKVSSFLASPKKLVALKSRLQETLSQQSFTLEQLSNLLQGGKEDLIITVAPASSARVLQALPGNNTVGSRIFSDISPFALSGLWVSLFLLVVLCIGVGCLMDLKTNDRFARQNLWVGRES